MTTIVQAAYIVSALLFIMALAGLSKHETAKTGNGYGVTGPRTRAALNALPNRPAGTAVASICPAGMTCTRTVSSTVPQPSTTYSPSSTFTRTLKLGSTGPDVKALQKFFNTHGFTISSTGNGSPGNETTYYGPATASAVSRFQEAYAADILSPYGLTQGTGNFGAGTMKKVNGMMK